MEMWRQELGSPINSVEYWFIAHLRLFSHPPKGGCEASLNLGIAV
jgi:hypothetical protein